MGFDHMMAVFNTRFPDGGLVSGMTLKAVANTLAARAHSETGECFPGWNSLLEYTGLKNRESLQNALDILELLEAIRIVRKTYPNGEKTNNHYIVRRTEKVNYLNRKGQVKDATAFAGWSYGTEGNGCEGNAIRCAPPWFPVWRPFLVEAAGPWDWPDDDKFAMFHPTDKRLFKEGIKGKPRFVVFDPQDLDVSRLVKPDPLSISLKEQMDGWLATEGNHPLVPYRDWVVMLGNHPSHPRVTTVVTVGYHRRYRA